MNNKKGVVVVLYNPTQIHIENIFSYIEKFDKVWIIDNSEQALLDLQYYFKNLQHKIEVIQDGVNKGIAKGINIAIKNAIAHKHKWLLTMDQDSSFEKNEIDKYINIIQTLDTNTDIALIGANIENNTNNDNETFLDIPHVITSGTFINLSAQPSIGEMNESLFIDEVDTEYSYRCQLKGWRVVQCQPVSMKHTLGKIINKISFKSFHLTKRFIHPPIRLYYITRNYLWVRFVYKKHFPVFFRQRKKNMFVLYKNNILYNPERLSCLKMIYRGYCDFKHKKMGKLI